MLSSENTVKCYLSDEGDIPEMVLTVLPVAYSLTDCLNGISFKPVTAWCPWDF